MAPIWEGGREGEREGVERERERCWEITCVIVLTAVKFIGSMGFQDMELVFVCSKRKINLECAKSKQKTT